MYVHHVCADLPLYRKQASGPQPPRAPLPGRGPRAPRSQAHATSSLGGKWGLGAALQRAPPALGGGRRGARWTIYVLSWILRKAMGRGGMGWRLWAAFALTLTSKAAGLSAPILFKNAVDCLAGAGPAAADPGARMAMGVSYGVGALAAAGVCRAVAGVASELRYVCFQPLAREVGRAVGVSAFEHIMGLDMSFHLGRQTGSLSRVVERGTRAVAMIYRAAIFTFLPTILEIVVVCGLLYRAFSPATAGLVLATFVAYVAWTVALTGVAAERRKLANELDTEASGKLVDTLLNFETVSTFNGGQREVGKYDSMLTGYLQAALQAEYASTALNMGQAVVLATGMTAILVNVAQGCVAGASTVGDIVMAQGLLLQVWAPLQFLGWFYRELRQSLVDLGALFDILDEQSGVVAGDRALPAPVSAADGGVEAGAAGGLAAGLGLEVRGATFGYLPERTILHDVDLSVAPGESVAFVGPSGSGKSSLVKLILRLYDPWSGRIQLDGMDVRDLTKEALHGAIAVVPQDTVLFNDTLYNNILYGRPDADREQVLEAVEAACLGPALERMPEGLETVVGERGLKLSGGEKQRVAIARAFLKSPRLLLCDEATSALDSSTEAGIMDALTQLARGRTSVFVAHRLSTIQNCDKIVVLRHGRVKEQGSHAELMEKRGLYCKMWRLQERAVEDARERGRVRKETLASSLEV